MSRDCQSKYVGFLRLNATNAVLMSLVYVQDSKSHIKKVHIPIIDHTIPRTSLSTR